MPGGGTSRYTYDTLGRMTSRHHPDADGPIRYKYNDLGRVRFSQDARQRAAGTSKVTYTVYDAFGRVTRVGEATATFSSLDPESTYAFETDATSWRSRMTYDGGDAASGDATSGGPNYAQGHLAKVEDNTDADATAEVTRLYAYDHLGNVRVKQVEIDGLTGDKTFTYVHDLSSRITRLVYPDGTQARDAYTTLLPVFRYPAKLSMVVSQKVQQDGSLSRYGRCQQARNRPKHGTVISNAFARMLAMTYITRLYHLRQIGRR